jgi:alpha-amylase
LDYIKSLGMTTIWLTPVMDNAPLGYHGYWIHDFYEVDEHFGTLDDFKELVDEAHKRDMKVILDYVVNHTGENSP